MAEEAVRRQDMASLTRGLTNKSEMMRRLHVAGYSRTEIAKFIGVRYQFVRNVIADAERRQGSTPQSGVVPAEREIANATSARLKLGADGTVVLPRQFREALSVHEGDSLIGVMEDGELRLLTIPAAVRRAQAIVRRAVPEGISLVDELLDERRHEIERENDHG